MYMKEYIEQLGVAPGTSQRFDCPECGGKNTLSVTHNGTETLWNCYKASCELKGRGGMRLTLDNAADFLTIYKVAEKDVVEPFVKPHTWKSPDKKSRDFFDSVYTTGRYDELYHDIKRNRAVYPIRDRHGVLVDGVGRTLEGARPKWYRYGSYKGGFVCGRGDVAVVVEDVPSAISISDWVVGYALMGTSCREEHIDELKHYKRVVVALDHDATDKALSVASKICKYTEADYYILSQDLKAMGEEERETTIRSILA